MEYRQLGQSNLRVSVVAFGAWQLGDQEYWGACEASDLRDAVATALDVGINLFDTAEMYGKGESERMLGALLGDRKNDVYIASKVSPENCAPGKVRAACEASLQRLQRDYIDLYQIHWSFPQESFADVFAELDALRDEGKIRHIGVSNFGRQDLAEWCEVGDAVSNQVGYNLLFRAPEYEVIPPCYRQSIGVLAYMPLMQGLLSGRWNQVEEIPLLRRRTRHFSGTREGTRHGEPGCEMLLMDTLAELTHIAARMNMTLPALGLNWLKAQPGITSILIGARHPGQVRQNVVDMGHTISPAMMAIINEITAPLKRHFGSNADLWNNAAQSRIR